MTATMYTCESEIDMPAGPHPGCAEFTDGGTATCGANVRMAVEMTDVDGDVFSMIVCDRCVDVLITSSEPGERITFVSPGSVQQARKTNR